VNNVYVSKIIGDPEQCGAAFHGMFKNSVYIQGNSYISPGTLTRI
jgi:hypothetical protein